MLYRGVTKTLAALRKLIVARLELIKFFPLIYK